jgi:DNA repair exonuclease SbcCD ATPase subunit
MTVRRFVWMAVVLGIASQAVMAQQGHGGPPKPSNDTSIQDFKRAMAVQAAPDQISDFQALEKNTVDARQQAKDLQEKAGAASDGTGFYKPVSALKDAIDQIENDGQSFVKRFSKAQTVLLKENVKKFSKAQAEVAKESKSLDEQMKRSAIDPRELAGVAARMDKVLADLQAQQMSLADEMGIPKS